jgi:hypothetical protein
MKQPNSAVRIVAVPPGEAPFWVGEKWVGLELPMAGHSGHRKFLAFGVLSMPRSWLAQWFAVACGRADRIGGYAIEAEPAVDILALASPQAAAWWRQTVPDLVGPKRYLVFHEHVCQVVDV